MHPSVLRCIICIGCHRIPGQTIGNHAQFDQTICRLPRSESWHCRSSCRSSSPIFAHLDFKELIRATHVCQGWKATIAQDPAAQKTLFLIVKPITRVSDPAQDSWRFESDLDRAPADCNIVVQVNPLLRIVEHNPDPYADLRYLDWELRRPRLLSLDLLAYGATCSSVTQSPCKEFEPNKTAFGQSYLDARYIMKMLGPDNHDVIHDEEGVRLGKVVDEFEANGWGSPAGDIQGCVNKKSRVLDTALRGSKTLSVRDGKVVRER